MGVPEHGQSRFCSKCNLRTSLIETEGARLARARWGWRGKKKKEEKNINGASEY